MSFEPAPCFSHRLELSGFRFYHLAPISPSSFFGSSFSDESNYIAFLFKNTTSGLALTKWLIYDLINTLRTFQDPSRICLFVLFPPLHNTTEITTYINYVYKVSCYDYSVNKWKFKVLFSLLKNSWIQETFTNLGNI